MPLLSVSPIARHDESDAEVISAKSLSIDADAHIRQFESIFNYYDVHVHNWALCQLGDS